MIVKEVLNTDQMCTQTSDTMALFWHFLLENGQGHVRHFKQVRMGPSKDTGPISNMCPRTKLLEGEPWFGALKENDPVGSLGVALLGSVVLLEEVCH